MPDGTELDVAVDDQEEQEGRERGGRITLLVITLLGLGVGSAVGMKALGPALGTAQAARAPDPSEQRDEGGGTPSALHMIDNLVVNPAHSGGTRFLLTSIAVEVKDPGDLDLLVQRDVGLRDALIVTLGAKTVDELTDIGNRAEIADEIFHALAKVVGDDVIRRIYIPQFVIQ